jgi:hypothetical protein
MNPTITRDVPGPETESNVTPRRPVILAAGLGGALVRPELLGADYSYRSVAGLSKRGQERTWPATAQ